MKGCDHPPGRAIPEPIVREFLHALGVETCPRCYVVTRIRARARVWVREGEPRA